MSNISFHYLNVSSASFKNKAKLKVQLVKLLKRETAKCTSLQYIFCTDDYLLGINKQFLKHNYYTDIITFNLAPANHPIEGEIYISLDRVRDNANQHNTSLKEELHRVIFHGALHLCGYKDKSQTEISTMRAKEDFYLKQYFQ